MLNQIEPRKVWDFFYQICAIPHPSKQEEKLVAFLEAFAIERGLAYSKDDVGNFLIKKNSTDLDGNRATIVLQSHLDMVCEKLPEVKHDFAIDPILPKYENGWVKASGTTLGADNGIGVAVMLAVLDSDQLIHGDIEALFTIDEETGLTGAMGLKSDFLKGKILLNLDSEDDGEIYIGCAGGIDTVGTIQVENRKIEDDKFAFKISVFNLEGGHSGDDIHKGLHSANVVLAHFLSEFYNIFDIQLVDIDGGNLRNAIARDAYAVFVTSKKVKEDVRIEFNVLLAELESDLKKVDPNARVVLESYDMASNGFSKEASAQIISAMIDLPHGVVEWSEKLQGFVKTSTNFASIKYRNNKLEITTSQRSSSLSSKKMISSEVASVLMQNGFSVVHEHEYPGWESDISSGLIEKSKKCYFELFNEELKIKEIHAGLECGLFSETFNGMEIISFGPTIRGAHSPNERIEVEAVVRFWDYLAALLNEVSKR